MRRFRRSALVLVPAVLSAFAFSGVGTSNAALLSRQLTCNDGTNLSLTLNLTQLTQLTNAIAAMTLYPAGLSCTLSLLGLSSAHSSSRARTPDLSTSSSQHDYAVGGGQGPAVLASRCPSTVFPNFGLSAHVASGTTTQGVGGTFNVKVPANAPCVAQLVSTVDCLRVVGNRADFTAFVTQASGELAFLNQTEISVAVLQSSDPSTPDMIDDNIAAGPCDFRASPDAAIVHGHIAVSTA